VNNDEVLVQRFYDAVEAARAEVARREAELPVPMNVPTKISDEDILAMDPGLGLQAVRAILRSEDGEQFKVNRVGDGLEIAAFLNE
jgi:hypothetical protein